MEIIDKAAGKLKNTLLGMRIPELLSSMAADYTKRGMESQYDRLAKTRLFQSLKNRSDKERYFIEFAFYFFNAFLKRATDESTPFRAYFKEVATDFFPEMGKRLINGDTPEGKEVLELAYDEPSKMYVHAPGSPPPKKESGIMNPIRERCIKYLENRKQGGK